MFTRRQLIRFGAGLSLAGGVVRAPRSKTDIAVDAGAKSGAGLLRSSRLSWRIVGSESVSAESLRLNRRRKAWCSGRRFLRHCIGLIFPCCWK